jgi:hypothetical protein
MMADEWSDIMLRWGIPLPTIERFTPLLRVWGFFLILLGWVVIGLAVVVILIWVT